MYTIPRRNDSDINITMLNFDLNLTEEFRLVRKVWMDTGAGQEMCLSSWLSQNQHICEHKLSPRDGDFVVEITFKSEKDFLLFKLKYC